jgi:hypothetical protein
MTLNDGVPLTKQDQHAELEHGSSKTTTATASS